MNEQEYVAKIQAMVLQLRDYRAKHPETELLIRFKAPKKMMVCATLKDAITGDFLSVNPAAEKMFDELGWIKEGISYLMLKVTIEHEQHAADGPDEEAPRPRF